MARKPMVLQSLVFKKTAIPKRVAVAWAKARGYRSAVDEKKNTFRLRQREPSEFDRRSFRTKKFLGGDVQGVLGHLKNARPQRKRVTRRT
jgi:hypothetical protein